MQQETVQGFRLARQQKRLWLLQGEGGAYVSRCALLVEGALDASRLRDAAARVVARHEILRTNFRRPVGVRMPVQVVADEATHAWREVYVNAASEQFESVVEEHYAQEGRREFDLSEGSPAHFTLLRFAPERHVLFVTLPALCADARTLRNLCDELAREYEASPDGGDADEEEPVQFAQFAEWQRELLAAEDAEEGRSFWRGFAQADADSAQASATFEPATFALSAGAELTARVDAACARHGVTAETFLEACWRILLARHAGRPEVLVNVVGENRVYEEMEAALGLYAAWLPVALRVDGRVSFAEFVAQVSRATAEAREWQEYFSREQSAGEGSTESTAQPLSFAFSFEELPHAFSAGAAEFTLLRAESRTDRVGLELACVRNTRGLDFEVRYDAAAHASEFVNALAARFLKLVESAAACAEAPVGTLDVLPEEERHLLTFERNDTRAEGFDRASFVERFEAQARRTPDAVAVGDGRESYTFDTLNRRANRLARRLRALGVGADSRVVIFMERSAEMLVGLLGVWKAGGAYVPLDASQPPARLGLLLADVGASAVLTQSWLKGRLPQDVNVVCLDAEGDSLAGEGEENLGLKTLPRQLAYVIYTSGSTGVPKGVMIQHASLMNLAGALSRDVHGPSAHALRVSLNAPLAFDSSVKQLLQLLEGHALSLVPEDVRRDTDALLEYVRRERLDVLDCTPSQLRLLVDAGLFETSAHAPARVLVGGEAIDEQLWSRLGSSRRTACFNVYGPTECTVDATACRVSEESVEPTIGGPLANTQVYILDEWLNLAPVGVAGELYIGGAGVARGYLNRPALTAERFVPDPFGGEHGARMYRTGDLARWNAEGRLVFLGRADDQVKIRGSRIELGEIESALAEHAGLRRAVVVAREDAPGDKRLVAYVVARRGDAPQASELRAFLQERLPDYMIPAAFVALAQMPLTPNGKVDRKALPAPDPAHAAGERAYVAPRTPVEELLASVWQQLLGVARVGVEDNFFELGGHSLLATQVVSQLRRAFRIELPLRTLFEEPVLERLAQTIERSLNGDADTKAAPIERATRDAEALPLSFAQQRLWFLYQLDPDSAFYNIPAHLRLTGRLDASALRRALDEIVARHESLRTNLRATDGRPFQVVAPSLELDLHVVDLSGLEDEEREVEAREWAAREAGRPFDLANEPLVRAVLVKLSEESHLLLLTFHHVVSDGWSAGVLIRELDHLYRSFERGEAHALPALQIQYADFAVWQRSAAYAEALKGGLEYWRRQLGDLPPALELPTDFPRPPRQRFRGRTLKLELAPALAEELRALGQREGATLFMTLLAGWKALLARHTGQTEVVVGTPVAGRTRAEVEPLIGFFVNTLPLRTSLAGAPTVRELLRRVRETALGAFSHQDVPFELLVEELQPERDLSRAPLFQVLFILQNAHSESPALGDLGVEVLRMDSGTAKFDLTLSLEESRDGALRGWVEYDTDLFEEATVARMLARYELLLRGMTRDAERNVAELALLNEGELSQLLEEFNDTRRDYGTLQTLPEMFARQVAATPDAVALVHGSERLTYAELSRRVRLLASRLRSLGVEPEELVGVCAGRGVELVVALLAVMESGGAYLPLDPAYPTDRLSFMLEDARVRVLLTESGLSKDLPAHAAQVVLLDEFDWSGDVEASSQVEASLDAANLAYVIYTSGSTGRPKGVAIAHGSAATLLRWSHEFFSPEELSRVLFSTSVCFDLSVFELFAPLTCGGAVLIARDALALAELPSASEVTLVNTVPSAMAELLRMKAVSGSVRAVNLAGEALRRALVDDIYAQCPSVARVVNLYGPTEDTTYSTWREVVRGLAREPEVGRGVANTRAYVLDSDLRLVPRGVRGELYLAGEGLARGYLNRPELTAERFVSDPFSNEPGARMYRTGDVVRWTREGELEYFGRADHQVKVRGFRIELGEVEVALRAQSGVRACVVVAREDARGQKQLAAYVAPEAGCELNAAELRKALRERLPEYMVPSAVVVLDELPLTPNGKVDRKRLPAPEQDAREGSFVAPRNALEELLAGYWGEVLGLSRVGVEENFFDLGGHSLLAVQIITRVRDTFQVELPLRDLFEEPTVAGLADKLLQEEAEPGSFEKLAQIMRQLSQLSEEETELLLQQQSLLEAGELSA